MGRVISVPKDIKPSVAAPERVCKELEKSATLRSYLADPASIVHMTKDELLGLARKCESEAEAILRDIRKNGHGMESVLTSDPLRSEPEKQEKSESEP